MPRVPDEEIERLKRDIAVERLAEARGIVLARHGQDLIGLCPFHNDREPSLVITPAKNLWHCLGACQAGGSVIDWVMRTEGVSFRHAVELLRADYPLTGASRGSPTSLVKSSTVVKLESPFAVEADERELLDQVITYYHETLKVSTDALEYLDRRGLKSPEVIERFKLGYANRTLAYRLPDKNRIAGAQIRTKLQTLGILRESGHEHFNGSIVIPVFDEQGIVTEVYGRKITSGLRTGTPLHMYLPGPHRGVWNIEALQANREIILCEALIDALTFWCAGYRNVTASYGVEGFTADHLAAFKRYSTERVLIAYDRDEAGEKAAEALAQKLIAEDIACYRIQFPEGMDANEYTLKTPPAENSLGLVIRSPLWLGGREQTGNDEPPQPAIAETALSNDGCDHSAEQTQEPVLIVAEVVYPEPEAAKPEERQVLPSLAAIAAQPPPASPVPPALTQQKPVQVNGEQVIIELGDRRYRVRGLAKNLSYDHMKVTLYASRGDALHVDTVNLCSAYQRTNFGKQAGTELGVKEEVIRRDLGRMLLALEELQDEQIRKAMEPKQREAVLSDEERDAALDLLRDPRLLDRILEDFRRCGVVGEETNKLMGYLAAVSRKLDEPLAVIIQSSSSAGKTALMEAVLAFMPPEEKVKYSAMTGQSLFYMSDADLKHKILAIVEEEGAQQAAYALKLLQSEGELTIASTGKDPQTGRLVTHEYRVEGPVMILITTTAVEIDEELFNRCVVLSVNEDREQTRAIHRLQREQQTLDGLWARQERKRIIKLHQDSQRLLRPLAVINPYAQSLTFLDDKTRTRRDHSRYLTLINTIALLHQYQRQVKADSRDGETLQYIEVTLQDIETANGLTNEAMGRSLDELTPQTRRLLMLIDQMAARECQRLEMSRSDYRFTRRQVREHTGWSSTQTRVHLERLIELEYILTHRGRRGQSFEYELLYDGKGEDGKPFLMGLIDVQALNGNQSAGPIEGLLTDEGRFAGGWQEQDGVKTATWRGDGESQNPD